ncbi:hypothetical protein J3492_07955 [Psychrobacter sp. F1192]|uniref:ATP-grasp domain-containing protein n=1 Tax=Psychrobacter coccoides TaxID=2818440 RepID=A0ABS3NQ02_9GAMM|nr:sugar-transfer associated ATP-grasp domain-containing protein [Psychrobacter coccoides]MBO1531148.1 hypothetical protein [Psychrobacter coccoides]
MKFRKVVKNNTVKAWNFLSVYSGFYKSHKSIYNSSKFEKKELTKEEKKLYWEYWKRVSPIISYKTVEISKSLSGEFDKRIVPEEFFPLYIEYSLNRDRNINFLANKSVYNKWFGQGVFPKDFFHKVDGDYYSHDLILINNIDGFIEEMIDDTDFPIVIKPNKESYGGKDVYFVNSINEIKEIISQHPNLVVQEKIKQSELINIFNKDSVNTVRVCLYKDDDGVMHMLNASLRMGKDGSLDNMTDGGIVCNIKSDGTLNGYANDILATKYLSHPNSGYVFKNKEFPLYDELVTVSKSIARAVINARLISLDMALDAKQNWRCIEVNLAGQTIEFPQNAGFPFFGQYTEEVINGLKLNK